MQEVIIPWRDSGCVARRRHFDFLHAYYSRDFRVIVADHEGEFNRSAARNAGVREATGRVVVVIDADNYIPLPQIHEAVEKARRFPFLVKPFSLFGYLTEESTERLYAGDFSAFDYMNPPGEQFSGGAYVMQRDAWLGIGGMDEGFTGWGAEDDAFHILCRRRLGKIMEVPGMDYHLWHPAHRVTSPENYDKLMREYVNGNFAS